MNNTIRKSDGRLLSGLFFRVMAPQVFLLLLNGINNLVDGLVGANFLGADVMAAIGV